METVLVQLTNKKAYNLLKDLEELDIIKLIKRSPDIASLRGMIKTPMSNEEIDKQLTELRDERKRDF
jgi:hypothetical protein